MFHRRDIEKTLCLQVIYLNAHIYEHWVPYVKRTVLQGPFKNPEAVNESCSMKKIVLKLCEY